ncbi:MAG: glycosyltransferase family 4 protein [Kiritimatiellia bacterium]
MRILFLLKSANLGGTERCVETLAHGFMTARNEVLVIVSGNTGPFVERLCCGAIPHQVLKVRHLYDPRLALRLRSAVRAFRPDVIYNHEPFFWDMTRVATGSTPLAVTHHLAAPRKRWWLQLFWRKPAMEISPLEANAIDLASLPAPRPQQGRSLGMVGRMVAEKNWTAFCEIALELLANDPALTAYAVGDGPLRAELQTRYRHPRLVFTGNVADARPLIGGLTLLVSTSRAETFGLTALEAMAYAVPVVANAACLFSQAIPAVETLSALLYDAQRVRELGNQGRLLAQRFDLPHVVETLQTRFSSLCTPREAPLSEAGLR